MIHTNTNPEIKKPVWRSRRFITTFLTAVVDVLVVIVPELEPIQSELLIVVTTLGLALLGSYTLEDTVVANNVTKREQ